MFFNIHLVSYFIDESCRVLCGAAILCCSCAEMLPSAIQTTASISRLKQRSSGNAMELLVKKKKIKENVCLCDALLSILDVI